MSTSSQSFEQVRSILSKLDRDIDAARAKRLNTGPTGRMPAPAMADRPGVAPQPIGVGASQGSHEPGQSGYGIARPLRRNDD